MNIKNYHEAMEHLYPFLKDYLEEHGHDTSKHFHCISPDHPDKTPSCSVVPSGNAFHCFGCGISGGLTHAAHYIEGKPLTGPEFITETLVPLCEKYGVAIDAAPLTEEQIYELDTYKAYRAASEYITNGAPTDVFNKAISDRQWTPDLCREFSVGSIKDYEKFRDYLKDLGFKAGFLDDVDLSRKDIFGDDRLIFTIKDEHGKPVGFSSRNLNYKDDKSNGAKYVNQRGTGVKCNIYKKSTRLFGFDRVLAKAGKKPKPLYIFEGYSDVLTAVNNGIDNCVALGGTALTIDQLHLLKEYNYYQLILCLDGDLPGQKRVAEILDNVLSGHKDLKIQLVIIPEAKDPDQYIRENTVAKFKKLKKWTAFEWRLSQFDEDEDPQRICDSMIPLIVNETSYLVQEEMCETLAKATGYMIKTIQSELMRLQNKKEEEKSKERRTIVDKLLQVCQRDPEQAEYAMQEASGKLFELARKYEEDSFSEDSCISKIITQKNYEEAKDGSFTGFKLGQELRELQNKLCGEWRKDVWFCFGGKPNSGKTSFMCKLMYDIARHVEDNNACVIYHTIDDTAEQILPKLVCIAEGTRKLSLNMVMDPKYHANNTNDKKKQQDIFDSREMGYAEIINLVRNGRLVVKDANEGSSVAYADRLITYYKNKYPERNIVYVLDNFHKLQDFANSKADERVRFKELSKVMKSLATKHHIAVITTVEYRKTQSNARANNADISETIQIEYDANLIAHLHNPLHDKGDKAKAGEYHLGDDGFGNKIRLPCIELDIGKNKVTAFKNKLYFDFYPASSDFIGVAEEAWLARQPQDEEAPDFAEGKPFG